MDLINHTGVPAELFCSDAGVAQDGTRIRTGLLVAKLTFVAPGDGSVALDFDSPHGVFTNEEPTAVGIFPRDTLRRAPRDQGVDVMVLGHAHAPGGRHAERLEVVLVVDSARIALTVTGDRRWVQSGEQVGLTSPAPFDRIPMSWERTYGGSLDVWLDEHTRLPLMHPKNRFGIGFDAGSFARNLGDQVACGEGFPRYEYVRWAPNVEDPDALVANWEDDPSPFCWAPMPLDLGLRGELQFSKQPGTEAVTFAHPRLCRLDIRTGTRFRLSNVAGGEWTFTYPQVHAAMDYFMDGRRGTQPLRPVQIVLLSDERRFVVTYQMAFRFNLSDETVERSARLRLE